jgi:hypothetical protein
VTLRFGSGWSVEIPRSSAPTGATGRLTLRMDGRTGVLKVKATGLDLSPLPGVTTVSLSVSNHPGADWEYGFFLPANGTGTSRRY